MVNTLWFSLILTSIHPSILSRTLIYNFENAYCWSIVVGSYENPTRQTLLRHQITRHFPSLKLCWCCYNEDIVPIIMHLRLTYEASIPKEGYGAKPIIVNILYLPLEQPPVANMHGTMLGHNRILGSTTRKKDIKRCTRQYARREYTRCLRGKPWEGKTTRVTKLQLSLCQEKIYNKGATGGNDLLLSIVFSRSLPLSLSFSQFTVAETFQ